MTRMYYTKREAYISPSLVTEIHTIITKCTTCAENRLVLRRHTNPPTLRPATEPLTEVSVDIFGTKPASKRDNLFILVITNRFARIPKCVALRRITAVSVASVIVAACVSPHRHPRRIVPDQAPKFMSILFIAVMKMLGVEMVRSTEYHPQANGQMERYSHTMVTQLRQQVADALPTPSTRQMADRCFGAHIVVHSMRQERTPPVPMGCDGASRAAAGAAPAVLYGHACHSRPRWLGPCSAVQRPQRDPPLSDGTRPARRLPGATLQR